MNSNNEENKDGPMGMRGEEGQGEVEEVLGGAKQPELVVTGTVESLEKGLSEGEMALIRVAGEKAQANGQQLVIRYRLKETEVELLEKYGGEEKDKSLAQQVIYEKLKKIIPERSSVGTILGAKME